MPGRSEFPGVFAVTHRAHGSRGRAALRHAGRRRAGADAIGQDVLFSALRHGRGPFRRVLDDPRGALSISLGSKPKGPTQLWIKNYNDNDNRELFNRGGRRTSLRYLAPLQRAARTHVESVDRT